MSQSTPRATRDAKARVRRVAANQPDMTKVVFQGSDGLRDRDIVELMEALKRNTHLKSLTLRDMGLTDESASELLSIVRDHPRLEELDVTQNRLTARFIASLIEATKVQETVWMLSIGKLHPPMNLDQEGLITRRIEATTRLKGCVIDINDARLRKRIDDHLSTNRRRVE